jgi:hypothetical protein
VILVKEPDKTNSWMLTGFINRELPDVTGDVRRSPSATLSKTTRSHLEQGAGSNSNIAQDGINDNSNNPNMSTAKGAVTFDTEGCIKATIHAFEAYEKSPDAVKGVNPQDATQASPTGIRAGMGAGDDSTIAQGWTKINDHSQAKGASQNVKEAARLWKEMGVRSPYFKNWFGDWEVQSNKSGDDNNGRVTRNDRDGTSSIGRDGQGIEGMPDTKGLSEDSRSTRSSVLRIIAESRLGDGSQGSVKAAGIGNGVGIVGSSGEPAVLYHGTKDLIDAFDPYHHNRKDFGWMGRNR